jgi:hypothetical protein
MAAIDGWSNSSAGKAMISAWFLLLAFAVGAAIGGAVGWWHFRERYRELA